MNLLILIRQQLNVSFGLSALKWYAKHDKKKFLGGLALALLIVVSLIPAYFFVYLRMIDMIYVSGLSFGQPQLVLIVAFVMVSLLVLVFGIGFVMSTFYFSRDLPQLIPLPFHPREIIGAKFFVVLVQEYLTVIPLLLPVLFIYGRGEGVSLYFWLAGGIIFLLLPVIPLTIISAVILVMMRVTNLGQRKDFLRMAGMLIMIVGILVINTFLTRIPNMTEQEMIAFLMSEEGLVVQVAKTFPPALMATRSLTAQGMTALVNLGGFILLSLGGIVLTLFLGDRLFYSGLIGGEEISSRKSISTAQLERKLSQVSSPAMAIARREIKILLRTPIYLFNSVGMLLIAPIILVLPSFTGQEGNPLLSLLSMAGSRIFVPLVGSAVVGVMAIFTPAASSSFSREGRLFWISQTIPVSPRQQINGKILYSFLISLLTVPLLVLMSLFYIPVTFFELAVMIILGLFLSFPAITISLLVDLMRPYLTWDNPQKAIKQNLNVVLAMVISGSVFFLIYRLVMFLLQKGTADITIYLALAATSLVLGGIPLTIMMQIADARFRDIRTL
jgi:ABC-2 type transport system permease protein